DDPDMAEWVVGVTWNKALPRDQARRFRGAFANQNVVCKLRHRRTVKFLEREFEVPGTEQVGVPGLGDAPGPLAGPEALGPDTLAAKLLAVVTAQPQTVAALKRAAGTKSGYNCMRRLAEQGLVVRTEDGKYTLPPAASPGASATPEKQPGVVVTI